MYRMWISDSICSAALDARERATNIQKKGWWNRVFNSVKHCEDLASVEQLLENKGKKFEVCHFFCSPVICYCSTIIDYFT